MMEQWVRTPIRTVLSSSPIGVLYRKWRAWRSFRRACRLYAQFVRPGELAFDVGAFIGARTAVFLHLGARVVAVEPQTAPAAELIRRYGTASGFRLIPKALGAYEGESTLFLASAPMMASLERNWLAPQGKAKIIGVQTVEVTTLDALIAEYGRPTFVKIDVEGHEFRVLQGLTQPISALSIEFHPARLEATARCLEYLADFGVWEANFSVAETMRWSLPRWLPLTKVMSHLEAYHAAGGRRVGDVYVRFINRV
jgi:FkbM family methyltransferase